MAWVTSWNVRISQVLFAAAGAALVTSGVAIGAYAWPDRRASEIRLFLVRLGFFVACVGVLTTLIGIGLWH